jgi:two-component system response regulator AtoC
MQKPRILVIDDDSELREMILKQFQREGFDAVGANSGQKGLDLAWDKKPDLVLLDLYMPGMNGLQVLEQIIAIHPAPQVIMMTGKGDIATAVQAMKLGAADYLLKPFEPKVLISAVQMLRTRAEYQVGSISKRIVGGSSKLNEVWTQIGRYAFPDISILLLGESGTGKELFARAIHEKSKRHDNPFVALDCAALPDTLVESEIFGHEKGAFTGALERRLGRFEMASEGTLFLDEIGNLPTAVQAKLLRVIQERQFERLGGSKSIPANVRIISATNLNLERAIQKGAFREDLYFRLAEVVIQLPPLREREGDMKTLAEFFVRQFSVKFNRPVRGISKDTWNILSTYHWPGNVRELENTLKSSVLAADDYIKPEDLPEHLRRGWMKAEDARMDSIKERVRPWVESGLREGFLNLRALSASILEEVEQEILEQILGSRTFTHAELSKFLNVDPKTLRVRLKKFGLKTH